VQAPSSWSPPTPCGLLHTQVALVPPIAVLVVAVLKETVLLALVTSRNSSSTTPPSMEPLKKEVWKMFFLSTKSLSVPMLVFRSVVLLPVRCTYIWVVCGVNVGTLILFNDSLLMFGGQCRDNLIQSTYIQLRFWKSCILKCPQLYWGLKVKCAVFFDLRHFE